MTVELIQGLLLAFAIVVILMPPYIRLLRRSASRSRSGSRAPTATRSSTARRRWAGLLIIVVVVALYLLLGRPPEGGIYAPARRARRRRPARRVRRLPQREDRRGDQDPPEADLAGRLRGRRRLPDPADIRDRPDRACRSSAPSFVDPAIYVSFAAFAIIAASNGVNITDGLDGLAGGTLVFAFVAFLLVALLNEPDAQPNLAFLCALIIGALLGFLWFNVHPAQIFMGDSGSLALGATLAVIALITGQILVLPLIGLIFVIETALGHPPGRVLQGHRRQAASSGWRRSTTTSSWPAGTRRRSRSGSGSSGSWPGCSA